MTSSRYRSSGLSLNAKLAGLELTCWSISAVALAEAVGCITKAKGSDHPDSDVCAVIDVLAQTGRVKGIFRLALRPRIFYAHCMPRPNPDYRLGFI